MKIYLGIFMFIILSYFNFLNNFFKIFFTLKILMIMYYYMLNIYFRG